MNMGKTKFKKFIRLITYFLVAIIILLVFVIYLLTVHTEFMQNLNKKLVSRRVEKGEAELLAVVDDINDGDAIDDEDTEKIDIAYYVEQIEKALNYDKFFYSQPIPGVYERRCTDIYVNRNTGDFFFVPKGLERESYERERYYYCSTLIHHFERPVIDFYEYIDDKIQLEWIGNAEIDYGMEATYSLPELSEEDLAVLEEVCDYLYDELSYVLDEFTYDVYLGDIMRGYDDDKKYIMVHVAIIGERRYHRCIDLTEEQDGYDFWMYPSLLNTPINTELAESDERDEDIINNIVSLGYLVRRLEK